MSCNACRVLRKGCSDDCIIRPCLEWIESPDSQANATLFLAKFYGRAGLTNLIEASPQYLRPVTFRSLLYEACGRVVNPAYGSAGLLSSGNWAQCQAAVDAVLRGTPIMQVSSSVDTQFIARLKRCEIRQASNDPNSTELHKVQNRTPFKPPASKNNSHPDHLTGLGGPGELSFKPLPESWLGHLGNNNGDVISGKDDESMLSVETEEGFLLNRAEPVQVMNFIDQIGDESEFGLDLTLGLVSV